MLDFVGSGTGVAPEQNIGAGPVREMIGHLVSDAEHAARVGGHRKGPVHCQPPLLGQGATPAADDADSAAGLRELHRLVYEVIVEGADKAVLGSDDNEHVAAGRRGREAARGLAFQQRSRTGDRLLMIAT
ncbi:MAG: hypothetical protein WB783_14765 [Arenicellales bacterium]